MVRFEVSHRAGDLGRGMIHTGMVSQTDGSAEGWYKDPTGHHSERWFSDGTPTALVRDGHTTAQDPLVTSKRKEPHPPRSS